ncbi:MAG: NAD(P)/FAD-dependent oxidoreductase [Candidatus Dojkabacteria bacterium]
MNSNLQNNQYDLIIIGGGAAGQMAAISAKRKSPELKVAILDRTFALGRKILVCGAGRCNITNINLDKSINDHYYSTNPTFPERILKQFGYKDILNFFEDLGIELYVERKTNIGKLFPITDSAKTVTALLEDELDRLNIDVHLNTDVTRIDVLRQAQDDKIRNEKNRFELTASILNIEGKEIRHSSFITRNLIISAGGKTYPALGSNGSGYDISRPFGHNIIKPVPSALPLVSKNPLSHELQGVKMEIEVTSIINNKEIKTRTDDVMFTQYGFSGPAILNISREISIHINREEKSGVQIKLNFFPGKSPEQVTKLMETRWTKRPDQTLEKSLFGIFPNKIPAALLRVININKDLPVNQLSTTQRSEIIQLLTSFTADISATRGWNEAEFTAGGIDTTEINNDTLESQKIPGLYFCGEILDVDGDVGGFNLSWAWSSGYVAGLLK